MNPFWRLCHLLPALQFQRSIRAHTSMRSALMTFCLRCTLLLIATLPAFAADIAIDNRTFHLPAGFTIEKIAGPPLVNRPITADFDEQGRLYVSDSSGSSDKVQKHLEERPHRILRLEDTDGDGIFDK